MRRVSVCFANWQASTYQLNTIKFMTLFSLLKPVVELFPKVAAIYRGVRDQLGSMDEPKPTPWGFKLSGNAAMAQGIFEPVETELVRKLLEDADVLVNVGANVGYYCCHALSMGKPVIAFEPMQRNLHYLCKNIKANGWSGAEIFPIALSNTVGILEIYGGDTGASLVKGWANIPESFKTLVPCSTMDTVLNTRLDGKKALVLIDVEGAEKWILEGASKILTHNQKFIWFLEIMTNDHQPTGVEINPNLVSVFQLFLQNGYEAFSADKIMRPISIEEVHSVAKGLSSFETHNFIFRTAKVA
jgi:FkbM family methyltransferase